MRTLGVYVWWRAAYRRSVRSAFATVPFYRHRWAVDGRTDPVLVPGRTGKHGGAVPAADVSRALVDLMPLPALSVVEPDPERGLDAVAGRTGAVVTDLPVRRLDELDAGPSGLLHDPLLGYLGWFGECGRWHLDWRRVYARETDAGLAFTLLRQRAPRLVDVLLGAGSVRPCPRHGTPVIEP